MERSFPLRPDAITLLTLTTALVLTTAVWLGAHHAADAGPPLWTDADLPEVPPGEVNGYYDLPTRPPYRPEAFDALIHDYEATDAREIRSAAERQHDALAEHLHATAPIRARLRARERFVDPAELFGPSRVLPAIAIWRERSLAVLDDLVSRDPDAAIQESTSMWRQSVDYTVHCRSLVSCVTGLRLMQISLSAAELVASDPVAAARAASLDHALARTDLDAINLANGVVAEYLWARRALDRERSIFLDRADTDALLRERFLPLYRYAQDPNEPTAEDGGLTEAPLWWAYNPAGKALLLVTLIGSERVHVEGFHDGVASLRATRSRVRTMLRLSRGLSRHCP